MADEISKSELLSEILYNEFESAELLIAVDCLDAMRGHLADRLPYQSPEIRKDLMDLHGMVMDTSNGSSKHSIEDIYNKFSEVESPIVRIIEEGEKLLTILRSLNAAINTAWNEIEDEE